eukprot:CAMPEP_0170640650 /NCGR_PEP_ID=MMETSP0224-20130122/40342_1 /TAXON_ID=285029 /ORGANISM="Togula jolla, Strain CCCM 725" /LENGTH=121 /DNA_ID=CAMNT_0010971179 /DNA_START=75 /DNA_END=436 /DNA_ORIENTATION=-
MNLLSLILLGCMKNRAAALFKIVEFPTEQVVLLETHVNESAQSVYHSDGLHASPTGGSIPHMATVHMKSSLTSSPIQQALSPWTLHSKALSTRSDAKQEIGNRTVETKAPPSSSEVKQELG